MLDSNEETNQKWKEIERTNSRKLKEENNALQQEIKLEKAQARLAMLAGPRRLPKARLAGRPGGEELEF